MSTPTTPTAPSPGGRTILRQVINGVFIAALLGAVVAGIMGAWMMFGVLAGMVVACMIVTGLMLSRDGRLQESVDETLDRHRPAS